MSIKISLTQFLTFSVKASTSAKITYVRGIKSSDYSPAFDYWRSLRTAIQSVAFEGKDLSYLLEVAEKADERHRKNYLKDANKFINFVRSNDVTYFKTGKANWSLDDNFSVSASPELGMVINGTKYCVKLYYKVPSESVKMTKRKLDSMLTLMHVSNKDFDPEDSKFAVLNLQNGKIITLDKPIGAENTLALEIEAQNFLDIWNRI